MDARRFLWIVMIVALVVMLGMLIYTKATKYQDGAPEAEQTPAAKPAETAKPPAEVAKPPAETVKPPAETVKPPADTAGKPDPKTDPAPTAAAAKAKWAVPTHPVHEVFLGSLDKRTDYKFQLQLTSRGAAIETLKLSEHFATVADKRRWDKDADTYEQAVRDNPKLQGNYSLLNPVKPMRSGDPTRRPFATGGVYFHAEEQRINLKGPRWQAGEVTTDADGTQQVSFTALIRRNGKDHLRVVKTYIVRKGSHSVEVRLRAENLSGAELEVDLRQYAATGVPREDIRADQRYAVYGKLIKGQLEAPKETVEKAKKADDKDIGVANARKLGTSQGAEAVIWTGLANQFFASITYIRPSPESKTLAAPLAKAKFRLAILPETDESRTFLPYMDFGPYRLAKGGSHEVKMDVFAGAMDRKLFGTNPLYEELDYKAAMNFGACPCVITKLVFGLMWLLESLGGLVHNYGLGIIFLVALVRLCLHPLTKKGQVSMMAMQKLQPEMAKLKEQYGGDKEKLQAETMKLYKTAGFTPMLGCLPMLLQMPIWFALWRGLQASVLLRHAPFLPVWITDLAAPDALIQFSKPLLDGYSFPMIGQITSFNLLPILLGVAMFFQQKFSPQAAASSATGGQKGSSQKQMMYFMTGFFLLIFYNMPSGLNLYIMTSTFAGVAEQYFIRKHIRERQEAEDAVETKVAMPGKRFRGQKPKKPKGPFRTK